uniref:Uncharacterized protein n=1 Tax=Gracilaria firma TaxID=2510791 RepID=A0A1P8D6E2_9FLOR|nr:hypothetical protein [Gracilaria firma]APR74374.1 hypothetical protein [Gracilaria firma]
MDRICNMSINQIKLLKAHAYIKYLENKFQYRIFKVALNWFDNSRKVFKIMYRCIR